MSTLAQRADLIRTVPLLATLSRKHRQEVARTARVRPVARYERLISEGDRAESCFVLLDGRAEVQRRNDTVVELGPGSVIGELALLDGGARTATVTMLTSGEVLEIRKEGFDAALTTTPEIARSILELLATRLRAADETLYG